MVSIYERAKKETGYNATRFIQMVSDQGGLAAARQLLRGDPSEGFTTLWEKGRLDLTVEFHILLPEFNELFGPQEIRTARQRLTDYGMDVDAALADRTSGST